VDIYRPCESCDFTRVKLSNLHTIGKYGEEIGENWGKISIKPGIIGIFT